MQVELSREYSSVNPPPEEVKDAVLGALDNKVVSGPDGQNMKVLSRFRRCKPMSVELLNMNKY